VEGKKKFDAMVNCSILHNNTVPKTSHKGVWGFVPFQNISLPNNINLTPST